ncbi:asparagine synthetase B [Candidatus Bathyarchaeota archaeon]|nr:asparagine synthetase B [Candidatus Bathyarchaeota archaeon]
MSTIAVVTKGSNDPDSSARKALESMRVPQDNESKIIVEGDTAIGFVGSLASTGKRLILKDLENGSRITMIGTSELLDNSRFDHDHLGNEKNMDWIPNVLDTLSRSATGQMSGWSLVGASQYQLLGGRDIIGQCPLFWGENTESIGIASCRKALWSLGIHLVSSIPEGVIAEFGGTLQSTRKIGKLSKPISRPLNMDETASELLKLVHTSVKAVSQDSKRVGILFSGGLDSSIIAVVAASLGLKTSLYTAAFEDSSDAASAEKAATLLGLKLEVETLSVDEAGDILRKVIWDIESYDSVQVCVGMPIEAATRAATREGEKLVLSGSGADELFGGYSKYLNAYRVSGVKEVEDLMFQDVVGLGKRELLRDGAIGETNRVKLTAPFLNLSLVRFGLNIPLELKVQGTSDKLRKRVLRRASEMMGMPKEIVDAEKNAAQYSSKSLAVAKKLAKRESLDLHSYLQSIFNHFFPDHL